MINETLGQKYMWLQSLQLLHRILWNNYTRFSSLWFSSVYLILTSITPSRTCSAVGGSVQTLASVSEGYVWVHLTNDVSERASVCFIPIFWIINVLENNFNNTPKALDPVLIVGQGESTGNSRLAPGGSVANNRLHIVSSRHVGGSWCLQSIHPSLLRNTTFSARSFEWKQRWLRPQSKAVGFITMTHPRTPSLLSMCWMFCSRP